MPTVKQQRNGDPTYVDSIYRQNGVIQTTEAFGGVREPWTWSQSTESFRGSEDQDYEQMSGDDLRRTFRRDSDKRKHDRGHPFFTQRFERKTSYDRLSVFSNAYHTSRIRRDLTYEGPFFPVPRFRGPYPDVILSPTTAKINGDGRKLINSTIPTAPEVSLATMLGELKEKLPSLAGQTIARKGARPSSAGGEYLNVEFGWKPLIGDIEQLAKNVADVSKIISQFRRDSGKPIRRRAHLDQTVERSIVAAEALVLPMPRMNATDVSGFFFGTGPSTVYDVFDEHVNDVWFSGAYSYHLSEAHDFLGKVGEYEQLANQLLGTRITPETIWELTPWSWLLDWFGDFGTFVSNVSLLSGDSTVLRYGYVMHKTVSTRHRNVSGLLSNAYGQPIVDRFGQHATTPSSISARWEVTTKQRTRATPYGFGLNIAEFTPRKWAILAALGLTKSDGALRRSG